MTPPRLLICFALLLFSVAASARQPTVLRGTVLDSTSLPIPNATVEFRGATTARTITDDYGAFSFADITAPGSLVVQHPGFAQVSVSITASTLANPLEIRMTPAPATERIEVSASTGDTIPPTPVSTICNPHRRRWTNPAASRLTTSCEKPPASRSSAAPAACSQIQPRKAFHFAELAPMAPAAPTFCWTESRSTIPSAAGFTGIKFRAQAFRKWKSPTEAHPTCTAAALSAASSIWKLAR